MKLFELIEPRITNTNIHRSNRALKHSHDKMTASKNTHFLGAGSYGQAVQHTKRPNSVIKSGIVGDLQSDGYLRYISALAKNSWAWSNPYFPRVYNIKTYSNENGDDMYVAEIEKLSKIRDTTPEVLLAIADRAFFTFEQTLNQAQRERHGFLQGKSKPRPKTPKLNALPQERLLSYVGSERISYEIAGMLTAAVQENKITNIKDPLLKQALMFIKKLKGSDHSDIRVPNLMVRHGPGGGQLVIIDPII